MEIKQYEEVIKMTAVFPQEIGLLYCTLGVNGEAGEIAEKVKKLYRDSNGEMTEELRQSLIKEIGDVIWYCAALSSVLGVSLEEVLDKNYEKLMKRRATNTLHGNGDDREEVK